MSDETERVRAALKNTPAEYLSRCLAQRVDGPLRAGSYFPGVSATELLSILEGVPWSAYDHPAVKAPAVAFQADVSGVEGVIPLDSLEPDREIVLSDPKGTGLLEATVASGRVRLVHHSVVLLGPHEGKEVVWTLHPGDPIMPSTLRASSVPEDKRVITVAQAQSLGLRFAKAT